ncbi:MFS transporter [Brachyspira catarrhinii]|uniref:MFS transporter n=1 Tax=Brachyspira catarrhinii TaxID=2528966 RepID=UPI0023517D50|nr:MFS transporter [Brachyspira catarrhinii]
MSFNFAMQVIIDFLSAKFVDRIGYRIPIVFANICISVGFILLGILPFYINPFVAILICYFLNAMGGGLTEVLVSPIVEALPEKQKVKAMNILHSFYCWGWMFIVILSTVYFKIFGIENWRYLSILWAILPIICSILFLEVPINTLKSEDSENNSVSLRKLLSVRIVLAFIILMICSGASEHAVVQWVSFFAEVGLNVNKSVGDIFGTCMFAFFMGMARLIYGMKSEDIDINKGLSVTAILCIIGYIVIVFSPFAFLSLIGCAIVGLSVGIMWPSVFSLASKTYPKGGTAMFAVLALAGDVGCSMGPGIVGIVSNNKTIINAFSYIISNNDITQIGLKAGIFFAIIFPILMFTILFVLRLRMNKN